MMGSYVFLFLVSSTSTLSKNQAAPTNPVLSWRIRHFVREPNSTAFIVKTSSYNIDIGGKKREFVINKMQD